MYFLEIRIHKIIACFPLVCLFVCIPRGFEYKYRRANFPITDFQRTCFCATAHQLQRTFGHAHVVARPRSNGRTQEGINPQHFFSFGFFTHSAYDDVFLDQSFRLQV